MMAGCPGQDAAKPTQAMILPPPRFTDGIRYRWPLTEMTKKIFVSHLFEWVLFVYFQDLYTNYKFGVILIQKILKGSQTFQQHCIYQQI